MPVTSERKFQNNDCLISIYNNNIEYNTGSYAIVRVPATVYSN